MKKIIINIGRQLGSGGRIIAKDLAEEFNCKFYDKEILNLAAKESGFSEKFFEQNDESKGFFRSLVHMQIPYLTNNVFYHNDFSQEGLFKFQSDAIRKAASHESCVFVGRCADYILRDYDNVINIFITAKLEWRMEQVMRRHSCDKTTAEKIIKNEESSRTSYYNYYTGKQWGDSTSYDLCVRSDLLGLKETEKYIALYIRKYFDIP